MFVWGETVGWSSVVNPLLRNPKPGYGNGSQISHNGSWILANGSRISFDGSQILSNGSTIFKDRYSIDEEGTGINDKGSQILDSEAWNTNEGYANNGSWIPAIGSQIQQNGFGIDDEEASWIGSVFPLGGFLGGLTAG